MAQIASATEVMLLFMPSDNSLNPILCAFNRFVLFSDVQALQGFLRKSLCQEEPLYLALVLPSCYRAQFISLKVSFTQHFSAPKGPREGASPLSRRPKALSSGAPAEGILSVERITSFQEKFTAKDNKQVPDCGIRFPFPPRKSQSSWGEWLVPGPQQELSSRS